MQFIIFSKQIKTFKNIAISVAHFNIKFPGVTSNIQEQLVCTPTLLNVLKRDACW